MNEGLSLITLILNLDLIREARPLCIFIRIFIVRPRFSLSFFFLLQTSIELMQEADFTRVLQLEEEYIEKICSDIIALKPDVVFTEKGISDLAQHFLLKVRFVLFLIFL